MKNEFLFALLFLAPLAGFLINGFSWRSHNARFAGVLATTMVTISFFSALALVLQIAGSDSSARVSANFFNWMTVDALKIDAAFVIDRISAIMALVVTGVGALIHLFSIGYMSHDERPAKYFAYLNFFLFNMLLLILGDNLLVMFVGWEGVGLCSYLLIGFWFSDPQKATAGMKAFITNRIGDAGFIIGIFLLFLTFGSVNFSEIILALPKEAEAGWTGVLTLATLALFVGATGKSAQIPLYVWLPDAMAGPTPVSALIHAATMVTAGVYMIVRLNPLFVLCPNTLAVISYVGAATAFVAATIGLTQWDIKKVLAYSTVSQLGYMFLACGVGAFGAALFHLMTHAFFKALMFLGSGSVIHAMDEEQDIRKMGGLKKYLPITHFTFLLGWLAIIGMPPFAGFFSKDEILWQAFSSPFGNKLVWVIGVVSAACTAFYMTRLMALTFWGKSRFAQGVHPHESPLVMTIPLMVLAFLSVIGGWIGIPHVLGSLLPGHPGNWLDGWLHGLIVQPVADHHAPAALELGLMSLSVGVAGAAAFLAYIFYVKNPQLPAGIANGLGGVYKLIYHKYKIDELYFGYIINPIVDTSKALWAYVDVGLIDKATYFASDVVKGAGSSVRTFQSGNLQHYAMFFVLGLVVILMLMIR